MPNKKKQQPKRKAPPYDRKEGKGEEKEYSFGKFTPKMMKKGSK